MTNIQLYLSIGIPTFVVLIGILLNLSSTRELSTRITELSARFSELSSRFGVLESDMRQFYHLTGKLEGRVDALEKQG